MTREDLDITRWRGFSHSELYKQLHSGPGATASAVPAGRWAALSSTLHEINQDLGQAITQAKASWSGGAANAAFKQLADVADWAGPGSDNATRMRVSVEQQADHIGRARAAMPAPGSEPTPQPDPLIAPVVQLIGLQEDHEPIERATSDATHRAFEVMQTYQTDTTTTTDTLASFAEPVDTSGYHQRHNRNLLNVLGFTQTTTVSAAEAPVVVVEPRSPGEGRWQRESLTTAQAGYMAVEPDVEVRRTPLQAGSMAGLDPAGNPITATPQRDTSARKSSRGVAGRIAGTLDTSVLPPAAAPAHSVVTPAAAPVAGGSPDRVAPRRVGDPLLSGFTDDAVEPVSQVKRRRDQDVKITESVEGAEAEVPPPVIGNGPYRQ